LNGAVQLQLGDVRAAWVSFVRALELGPDNAGAQAGLVALDLIGGDVTSATAHLSAVIDTEGETRRVQVLRADIAIAVGRAEDAINDYRKALDQQNDERTLAKYVAALQQAGEDIELRPVLDSAMGTTPQSLVVAHLYAAELERAGDEGAAIEVYDKIVAQDPSSVVAHNNVAILKQKAGLPDAIDHAKAAYELAPEDPNVLDTYGWILLAGGQASQALPLLNKAVRNAVRMEQAALGSIRYHQAVAIVRIGDKDKAVAALRDLLKEIVDFPEREPAKRLLEELTE